MDVTAPPTSLKFLARLRMDELLALLRARGFRVKGPRLADGAIVYDDIKTSKELPAGISVYQEAGQYLVAHSETTRWFAWANGPQALKPLLFQARETLWRVQRDEHGKLAFESVLPQVQPLAVVGVRACDIAALHLQDQHFLRQSFPDVHYARRREQLALIALNCTHPAVTCFCASTDDGPAATFGFDWAMTELDHGFIVNAGSARGTEWVNALQLDDASSNDIQLAQAQVDAAARNQTRSLPRQQRAQRLLAVMEHPQWDDVAERCLSCGNCTSVCPTCFCSNVAAQTHTSLETSSQVREWDSCFTAQHSSMHGTVVRADTRLRYRQWLIHKLATWETQYGRSGCVGCGRCINWCPVGIDLTVECTKLLS